MSRGRKRQSKKIIKKYMMTPDFSAWDFLQDAKKVMAELLIKLRNHQ